MRASTAFGGFLALAGFMILVLQPVYNAGAPDQPPGVEAVNPLQDIRPVPLWLGALSLGTGSVLLGWSWIRRDRHD
jgi:hypothetical protein